MWKTQKELDNNNNNNNNNNNKRTCCFVNFAVLVDHTGKIKESKKRQVLRPCQRT